VERVACDVHIPLFLSLSLSLSLPLYLPPSLPSLSLITARSPQQTENHYFLDTCNKDRNNAPMPTDTLSCQLTPYPVNRRLILPTDALSCQLTPFPANRRSFLPTDALSCHQTENHYFLDTCNKIKNEALLAAVDTCLDSHINRDGKQAGGGQVVAPKAALKFALVKALTELVSIGSSNAEQVCLLPHLFLLARHPLEIAGAPDLHVGL